MGPAGTGKSESCKDLAKAVGKMCVTFNCSEEVDHVTVANLLSGMIQVCSMLIGQSLAYML